MCCAVLCCAVVRACALWKESPSGPTTPLPVTCVSNISFDMCQTHNTSHTRHKPQQNLCSFSHPPPTPHPPQNTNNKKNNKTRTLIPHHPTPAAKTPTKQKNKTHTHPTPAAKHQPKKQKQNTHTHSHSLHPPQNTTNQTDAQDAGPLREPPPGQGPPPARLGLHAQARGRLRGGHHGGWVGAAPLLFPSVYHANHT